MIAPPSPSETFKPMLAGSYGPAVDPSGWLLSEKLDGVRAIWTGEALITRNGNAIKAPESLRSRLPVGVCLDGELWIGRGCFQQLAGIARSTSANEAAWSSVRFAIFDAPKAPGGYLERLEVVQGVVKGITDQVAGGDTSGRIFALNQVPCSGRRDLREKFRAIVKAGGEGLILRHPSAPYEHRRSPSLLKLKAVESDDAVVVGHEPGNGRLKGLLGSLLLRWRDRIISLGSGIPSSLRITPPAPGAVITFSFEGLTSSGFPRSASFLTLRNYE